MKESFFESKTYKRSIAIGRIIANNASECNCGFMNPQNLISVIRRDYNGARRNVLNALQYGQNERHYEHLIIKNNHVLMLRSANRSAGGSKKSEVSRANITKGFTNSGLISYGTRKKILNIGEIWHNAIDAVSIEYHNKYKRKLRRQFPDNIALRLITLTLSSDQVHPDQYIKRYLLNGFIEYIKRQGAINYLWRAEAQKTGKIHFHIITDCYLPYKEVNAYWVSLLKIHGYGRKKNDSPVNIKLIKSDELIGYVAKYISKNGTDDSQDQKDPVKYYKVGNERIIDCNGSRIRAIDGKMWGSSRKLSDMVKNKLVDHFRLCLSEYGGYVQELLSKAEEKIKTYAGKIINRGTIDEFFAVILNKMDVFDPKNVFSPRLYYAYLVHHKLNYLKLYDKGIPLFDTGSSGGRYY